MRPCHRALTPPANDLQCPPGVVDSADRASGHVVIDRPEDVDINLKAVEI